MIPTGNISTLESIILAAGICIAGRVTQLHLGTVMGVVAKAILTKSSLFRDVESENEKSVPLRVLVAKFHHGSSDIWVQ